MTTINTSATIVRELRAPLPTEIATFKDEPSQGLWLVNEPGRSYWRFRYTVNGTPKVAERSTKLMTLAQAREQSRSWNLKASNGDDPRRSGLLADTHKITFKAFAYGDDPAHPRYLDFCVGLNEREPERWVRAIEQLKALHTIPVAQITIADVIDVLAPIYREQPNKANLLRWRLETLLQAAVRRGLLQHNPAAWAVLKGEFKKYTRRAADEQGFRASLPFADMPALMVALAAADGIVASCARFVVLTGVRSAEARLARWEQFQLDGDKPVWIVPREQMKCKRRFDAQRRGVPHVVPLSAQVVALLRSLPRTGDYVFQAPYRSSRSKVEGAQPITQAALNLCFQRHVADGADICTHGARSSFRSWVEVKRPADYLNGEKALDHVVGNAVGRRYIRSVAFEEAEQRRELMAAWANLVAPVAVDNVIAFPAAA